MNKGHRSRPGVGQWLLLLGLAGWLALVPLAVRVGLAILNNSYPPELVQLELVAPGQPILSPRVVALFSVALTLALNLLVFVPLFFATRRRKDGFAHTISRLLIAIALFQLLNALARYPWPDLTALTAVLRLALVLPFLLLGLGRVEARRQEGSLLKAWRRVGLCLWSNPSATWLALGAGAVIVWPWVVVGSLGSPGTTAVNLIEALPNALNQEILFRGFALTWLWRAMQSRRGAAISSLILFAATQGGTVLPYGDWAALLRFGSALLLGLLAVELTIRAGGSIWPAVVMHFLYDWFPIAFADPRSVEEVLHWLAWAWEPLAAGGIGVLLWLGRKIVEGMSPQWSGPRTGVAASLAVLAWTGVLGFYLTLGVPGFHADGFLIFLEEQADLRPAEAIADPAERRAWVYQTLVETAERTQAPLRADLDRRGVVYRSHYLVNAIEVLERPGLRRSLARRPEVASVLFQPGVRRYAYPFKIPNLDLTGPSGVEWNVREVGADRVWDLGYTGQGVVVGSADSGVAWEHPALRESYLGWENGSAGHDYYWYDPWDGRPEPWDDNGHGTHTTGTMVGLDGKNQIGVAPGAQWIACRNMRQGLGNPGSYVSCMEFLLAPFPLDGDPFHDGDPAQGAHVVNNSWGCPTIEGCLPDTLLVAVESLRAAGQVVVASAGNEGPACGTVQDPPAVYDAALSVGATEPGDRAAGFSSRGPVIVDGSQRLKPDLVAPGVDIRSAVIGGYAPLPGTSMAGPHVAGAVALLWSAEPDLRGDVDRTKAILVDTAEPLTVDVDCGDGLEAVCGCGGDGPDSVPNQVYGWGQLDVWAAVQQVLGE